MFLDIKAAFDRVQKPALTHKLHQTGLRGQLAHFLTNFPSNKAFGVRYGPTLSDTTQQDQGLPQGSVLSLTLFLIMINDSSKNLPQKKLDITSSTRCLQTSAPSWQLIGTHA